MDFPRIVYKRGTGKRVDDNGLFTAESAQVDSPEQLAALAGEWCDSPVDAAVAVASEQPAPKPKKAR